MKLFSNLRLVPFILGGLLYAVVYGSCDYNYWGSWVLNLYGFLDFPFVKLVNFAVRQSSNPESSRLGFFFFAAVMMNAHIYGLMLSAFCAVVLPGRKNGPNQSLQPTTMSVTDRACARSAPATVVADL